MGKSSMMYRYVCMFSMHVHQRVRVALLISAGPETSNHTEQLPLPEVPSGAADI